VKEVISELEMLFPPPKAEEGLYEKDPKTDYTKNTYGNNNYFGFEEDEPIVTPNIVEEK
jgi:alpha-L-fucosidase